MCASSSSAEECAAVDVAACGREAAAGAASGTIDLSRTVVRRAESHAVQARVAGHPVSETVLHYLNRLSELLCVLARRVPRA